MFSRYDNGTRFSSGATVRGRVVGGKGVVVWAGGAWVVAKGGDEDPESDEPAEEVCVNGEGSLYSSKPASVSVGSRGGNDVGVDVPDGGAGGYPRV